MAKAKRKRSRKHRGTQGGRVDPSRRPRPRSRAEAKAQMRSRAKKRPSRSKGARAERFQRGLKPPSWRSATNRGLIAAAAFFVLVLLVFHQPIAQVATLSALMLLLYIPMGYFMDGIFYRRGQRKREREREGSA